MPTVTTSATPYCTAADLLVHVRWQLVADWVCDTEGPRPTRASLLDSANVHGAVVLAKLKAASGKLESACLRGGLYTVADLQALTGSTLEYLKEVVAGLVILGYASRSQPAGAEAKQIPAAQTALEAMEALRKGERVFGLAAQIDAGAGMEAIEFVVDDGTDPRRTVTQAGRFFGNRDRG